MNDQKLNILIIIFGLFVNITTEDQPPSSSIHPQCSSHDDCSNTLACVSQACVDPCTDIMCRPNSMCDTEDHLPLCICKPGFLPFGTFCLPKKDQPPTSSISPQCSSHDDCPNTLACVSQACVDPCNDIMCRPNSMCETEHHLPLCICKPGFLPFGTFCLPKRVPGCKSNTDCDHPLACISNVCTNPCLTVTCENTAICTVVDQSSICYCIPGYEYNDGQCVPLPNRPPTIGPKCSSNKDCDDNLACIAQTCMDPCIEKLCEPHCICKVEDHIPWCACKPGSTSSG